MTKKPKCKKCRDSGMLATGLPCLACGCGDRIAVAPVTEDRSLVLEWEPLAALLDAGLPDIVEKHWHEVGVHKAAVPLDVDWEGYQQDEEAGLLKLLSARRGDILIGYSSYYVRPHRHYKSTLHALNDAIFVVSGERGVGIYLIRAAERLLARLAADEGYAYIRILYHAKLAVEAERGTFARVFDRLGYAAFETCHDKVVETRKD